MRNLIVNCCAISNKHVELESFLRLHSVNLLCGTESHLDESYLNDSILNSELFPTDYCIYKKDRGIHGGGALVFVKNNISLSQVMCNSPIELTCVRIHNTESDIILGSLYCPHTPQLQFLIN